MGNEKKGAGVEPIHFLVNFLDGKKVTRKVVFSNRTVCSTMLNFVHPRYGPIIEEEACQGNFLEYKLTIEHVGASDEGSPGKEKSSTGRFSADQDAGSYAVSAPTSSIHTWKTLMVNHGSKLRGHVLQRAQDRKGSP